MSQTYMNTSIESENSILTPTLSEIFGKKINLARIKFFGLFIWINLSSLGNASKLNCTLSSKFSALCKVQSVCFERLSTGFDHDARVDYSLRRTQRIRLDYMLKTNLIARLVFALLPHKPPYRLVMDRTNWEFGVANINVRVPPVVYQGVAFPVMFTMLPKFGNSSTTERIELMERYINLFGAGIIDCLLADREFVGEHWLGYLNFNHIGYHIRNNFWVSYSTKRTSGECFMVI